MDNKIGIGTTTPSTPLTIRGEGGNNDVGITQNQLGGTSTMELTTADSEYNQATRLLLRGGSDDADIEFYRGRRGSEEITMFMEGSNGNVGIGTNAPTARLEVKTDNDRKVLLTKDHQSAISFIPGNSNSLFHISHGLDNNLHISQGSTVGSMKLMTIKNGGNVGIGTSSPGAKLDVHGTLRLSTSDRWTKIYTESLSHKTQLVFQLDRSRDNADYKRTYMTWDGDNNLDYSSDERLKTNIQEKKNILKDLLQLQVKEYQWKGEEGKDPVKTGFIAQEVQPVFPNLVGSVTDPETGETSLTLKYTGFGVLAVGAIKELKLEYDRLIASLREEIATLKQQLLLA